MADRSVVRPAMPRWDRRRWVALTAGVATGLLLPVLTGCASPGVPRPPSLHLPALVHDLHAVRQGNQVQLTFTAPDSTTDRQPLNGRHGMLPLTAIVCRVETARCNEFARLAVLPGQGYSVLDTLPPALTLGSPRALEYRVRVANGLGRDAGTSRDALTAAGDTPPAVLDLSASTVAGGIRLTWQAAPGSASVRVEAHEEPVAGVPAAPAPGDRLLALPVVPGGAPPGAVDTSVRVGGRVRYRVYRLRNVLLDGTDVPMESTPATVTVTRSDQVFPPAAPTALLAVVVPQAGAPLMVELSWEPSPGSDIVGYRVYRAAQGGSWTLLSTAPIPGISFQDEAVHPGEHWRYAVAAVNAAGVESARSSAAVVDVP